MAKDDNMFFLYLTALKNTTQAYQGGFQSGHQQDLIKRAAFYGVKVVNLIRKPEFITREIADSNFQIASITKEFIGLLTPGEFVEIFPIRKDFNGHKWESKDYFYTRDYINTLDQDTPIKEQEEVLAFLWEYTNWEVSEFTVSLMGFMDDLRRLDGLPSLGEEWAEINGIKTYEKYKDGDGNEFIVDDGKTVKLCKPKPRVRHLKVIK